MKFSRFIHNKQSRIDKFENNAKNKTNLANNNSNAKNKKVTLKSTSHRMPTQ